MTRETRIGLLVGLLFIVMFGLVLSELTQPQAPKQAQAVVQRQVSEEVPKPPDGGNDLALRAPNPAPAPVGPEERVASVDPDGGAGKPVIKVEMPKPEEDPVFPVVADAHPGTSETGDVTPAPGRQTPGSPLASAGKPYTVVQGDTLSRIAAKSYGPGHQAAVKLIREANKDKLKDDARLMIGQQLVIPPLLEAAPADRPGAPSSPRTSGVTPSPASPARPSEAADRGAPPSRRVTDVGLSDLRDHLRGAGPAGISGDSADRPGTSETVTRGSIARTPAPGPAIADRDAAAPAADGGASAPSAGRRSYVIQSGDTLSKIARKMFNSDSRASLEKIIDANSDKIKDPNKLPKIGTQLEIPS